MLTLLVVIVLALILGPFVLPIMAVVAYVGLAMLAASVISAIFPSIPVTWAFIACLLIGPIASRQNAKSH
jgi:hypothetical protein